MIILDTNVVSEPLRAGPDVAVIRWLDAQDPQSLFVTTVNMAELLAGVEILPAGRRRTTLRQTLARQLETLFEGRILAFDQAAAGAFARSHAGARAAGNPIGFADCAIAAIAVAHGGSIATRNVRDFRGTGVEVVNPWSMR